MIAGDLAYALDPVTWAQSLGFTADPWQVEVLCTDADRVLLNCCRQAGKSTVTALLALHTAIYSPGALVLLLSPSLRQSSELFRKVLGFYRHVEAALPLEAESALRLELSNGSRIVSLPGKEATVRGFSGVDVLVVDEAARVPDDLYFSVRPMLAVSNGRLIALSTPFGARGWWWQEWTSGGPAWLRIRVPAEDCPRISAAFLHEERTHLGEWWFRQEYACDFLDAQTAAFAREHITNAFIEEVSTWTL